MGQKTSVIPAANYSVFADSLLTSEHWKGIEVDRSLQMFSFLNSTEELNCFRDQVLFGEDLSIAASSLQNVGGALKGISVVPNAVGLGALVIAMILDVFAKSLNKQTLGTAEMLERVFAQEKANEVRDLMEEYLKRLQINLAHPQLQLAETRRAEVELSAQLTRLKNSMVKDGHMGTRFLKQWVNGAAFHTQMLIHQARLEGTLGSRALRAAEVYHQQLNLLLNQYKKFLKTVVFVGPEDNTCFRYCLDRDKHFCQITYREFSRSRVLVPHPDPDCHLTRKADQLLDAMFVKPQLTSTTTYFLDLQTNIPTLVQQNSSFHL
ncbi:uncharacterized protein LOC114481193 [Gouania willdenowi]|uniref:uncharacterized protein LOC114481193 n=1 Tax=Gouania willdenowi TaxID=441366 RepID=UPI0010544213|nr:uncharacterized protein LOC114481193 [Gouania willdenowi]XP_028331557.1 uncharacterized protein LOC114481193 [Gouania willdenowi]